MNKIIISVIAGIMVLSIGLAQDVYGPITPPVLDDRSYENTKAIPDWVKNQFKWYVNGEIEEGTLLTSMNWMFDNNIMHLSEKAAQEMKNLREENKQMHEKIAQYRETDLDFLRSSADSSSTNDQALHHLRKAYDLNPNLKTKVSQYDDKHKKWIDVLSIDWGTTSDKGDPDRPVIIGRIYSQDTSTDMALKGSKISENFVDATRQTPKTDFGTMLKAIDTEYKLVSSKIKLMTEISDRVSQITDKDMANLDSIKQELATIQSKLDTLKPQSSEMEQSFNIQYLQLQQKMQDENREFTTLSNVMKTKHDTSKNAINNIR